jgi:N4-gp56 family major capsid protein
MNKSYDAGIAPTLLESYLQRRALKNVELNLGYLQDAQMIEQPKHNGKHVTFFRYSELPAITKPLYEGVTPDGQKLTETAFSVMTKPFGAHMEYTDELDLFHVDSKTQAMSDRLNRQARLSIDTVGRDQICAGLNVMYPGTVDKRSSLTSSNILTYSVIKKAVRNLKKKGAQPFSDGFFHAKIDHDTYYDLTQDDHWNDVSKYQSDRRVQRYELGTIYLVKFFEVDNGKTFPTEDYLYKNGDTTVSYLTLTAYDNTTRIATTSDTISEDEARELTGKLIMVRQTTAATPTYAYTNMCIERVYPGSNAKIKFRWAVDDTTATAWATDLAGTPTLRIIPSGGAANGDEVHATIIYGQDAFGLVKLGGKGKPNIQIIVKQLGSSGSDDPLNQRGTIAWKVPHFACAVLQDDFIVRIEHGVSA